MSEPSSPNFASAYQQVLNELRLKAREDLAVEIRFESLRRWSEQSQLSVESFIDRFAVEIAHDYLSGFLNWDFCEMLANNMWHAAVVDNPGRTIELGFFEDLFEAFDESEMSNPPENDRRARTLVAEYLAKHIREKP
ncbi:hypothetical protein [Qipengyuania sp.]|uniref:hypothetical protein n=1 Tax=Qipengyuania sp. TaxID=2004515 RepID=UPI003AF77C25